VLPSGFTRIRHYGLLANRHKRALLARAAAALDIPAARSGPWRTRFRTDGGQRSGVMADSIAI
jgi:hypothetical protein